MLDSTLLCSGSHVNINTPVHGLPSVGRPVGAHVAVGEGEGEGDGCDGGGVDGTFTSTNSSISTAAGEFQAPACVGEFTGGVG